jgi:hypothetical protein
MPQKGIPAEIRQGPVNLDQMVVRSEKEHKGTDKIFFF